MGVIDNIPFRVIEESISVVIERDVIHDFRHCGVVDFNTNDANEFLIIVYRNVIGNHAGAQVFCYIRRQPDALSR